jgi:hypothetical protein
MYFIVAALAGLRHHSFGISFDSLFRGFLTLRGVIVNRENS